METSVLFYAVVVCSNYHVSFLSNEKKANEFAFFLYVRKANEFLLRG